MSPFDADIIRAKIAVIQDNLKALAVIWCQALKSEIIS